VVGVILMDGHLILGIGEVEVGIGEAATEAEAEAAAATSEMLSKTVAILGLKTLYRDLIESGRGRITPGVEAYLITILLLSCLVSYLITELRERAEALWMLGSLQGQRHWSARARDTGGTTPLLGAPGRCSSRRARRNPLSLHP